MHCSPLRMASVAIVTASLAACVTACDSSRSPEVTRPPALGQLSYQLGGAYPPPGNTALVVRDRTAEISTDVAYNVCYLNLLQTQPDGSAANPGDYGTTAWWQAHHPELLLRDATGELIVDADWNEVLFDVSTETNRVHLFAIHQEWIAGCAAAGFDAIEVDNIDANERSDGLVVHDDIRAYMTRVVEYAHDMGLAVAQKNAIDPTHGFGADGPTFVSETEGFDFAIVEQCAAFDECESYTAVYGDYVYDIEYDAADFDQACNAFGHTVSLQLRDLELTVAGTAGHIEQWC